MDDRAMTLFISTVEVHLRQTRHHAITVRETTTHTHRTGAPSSSMCDSSSTSSSGAPSTSATKYPRAWGYPRHVRDEPRFAAARALDPYFEFPRAGHRATSLRDARHPRATIHGSTTRS